MNYYTEPSKRIPVKAEVDVLVVGSGPAGFSAAVSAARQGAKTMLIEQASMVGGIATAGLMSHWAGESKGGMYHELLDRSCDNTGVAWQRRTINPEKLKTVMLEMLSEAGVILQFYTFASDAIMDGDKIIGVITESKSGREAIMAKVVIDASGDGDIAARAGAPFFTGRESDGSMQPMTLMFKVAGVDTDRAIYNGSFETTCELPAGDLQTLGRENIPHPAGHVLLYATTLPGVVSVNMTNCIAVDGTKAEDLTKAECVCRSQIEPIVNFLRKYVTGYENCFAISSASLMGVRETRHFEGERTLTPDDILQARIYDDWAVADAHFDFDVHGLKGPGLDETGCQRNFKQKKGYTIPYGCFVPKKIDQLLLAGRNISGTHIAHSSYRVMSICANMGLAVGVAAAMSAKKGIAPRNLDVKELQDVLKNNGIEEPVRE